MFKVFKQYHLVLNTKFNDQVDMSIYMDSSYLYSCLTANLFGPKYVYDKKWVVDTEENNYLFYETK